MWPKPRGISLAGKTMGLVGFGDTGRNIAKRALAADMNVVVYTRNGKPEVSEHVAVADFSSWPERVPECDFIVLACSLNSSNWHMLNADIFAMVKPGVRIVNVARGPLIAEDALIDALMNGKVHSVALDVFEVEPLPPTSPLRNFEQCILGSHNASNTTDAVIRTSKRAIELLLDSLGVN
jgi:D-3-phosphoglycerate dehydrogenase